MILKRMKRRHLRQDGLDVIARARALRPGIGIGADLIAGFPTETDELFAETLAMVQEAQIPFLHVFPYSERPGTPAAKMPPVPKQTRKDRALALREAAAQAATCFYSGLIGQNVSVLSETGTGGHTEHFAPARLVAPAGALVTARVIAADTDGVIAEAA
jgi:threonylcarbamoyladenosine tRNA methylthiotransferase MtaB